MQALTTSQRLATGATAKETSMRPPTEATRHRRGGLKKKREENSVDAQRSTRTKGETSVGRKEGLPPKLIPGVDAVLMDELSPAGIIDSASLD